MSEAAETPGDRATRRYKRLALVLSVVLALALLVALGRAIDSSGPEGPNFPSGGPAEFLYLDSDRAGAYLAQVNGGTFDSERLTSKLTKSLNAKLAVQGLGEAGGSGTGESSSERVVKPTAASIYFALLAALERERPENGGIVELEELDAADGLFEQGQFVSFETESLLSPRYLNAYLAVRNANTLGALFPGSPERQEAAREFFGEIGKSPRAVFALKRKKEKPKKGESECGKGRDDPDAPTYLLPMRIDQLTYERSLLKYGGGRFTVVGKVVRTFPERELKSECAYAYIDSPTLETWRNPLRRAPGALLCRTDPQCVADVRSEKLWGAKRQNEIELSRLRALDALNKQTKVERRGAVIIPIAIYK